MISKLVKEGKEKEMCKTMQPHHLSKLCVCKEREQLKKQHKVHKASHFSQ